uniref:HEAT repeat-containing protein 1 n=1 Tax=Toxoplasma gondii COUG TaxID=1074873 RepID=A0A2G8XTB3_TOXGO|nr:U3 small nucleolar RNA-associated protein 10 [Toxoplasma gondii COUG]
MVSELQRQLALHRQTRGVGSSSTASCSSARRQHAAPSLLFDPRKAASIDIETLRDVALTSLQSLSRREPLVDVLEPFFALSASRQGKNSPQSRDFMTEDQSRVLDRRVSICCDLLGPFFLLQDAQYLLEYLLRQYAIHQHNQDALLALALPYHNSPVFVRLVRLMTLPPNSPWIFLERMRASGAPLQRRDLVKVVLSSPFLLQFLVDTVARVSAPLSAARLKEASLSPLPSHLQDGRAGNDEILLMPTSRLPAQNTPLLSFFTLLVSESIVAAPSLAAVRTLTPCLLPFLLSTLHPTSAVRTPELHAAGLAILAQIAMRAPLDPAILVAAMQQLSQTLVLSAADDGLPQLSASKENEIFSLLVLIADKQSLALQGTLPCAVTRRLTKWTRLAAATEELLSDRQLDCAPFLRAFFKSLLSFFLSSSPGSAASFSPLQQRLLASAEALCGACVAAPTSRSRLGPDSPCSPSLAQMEASPSLIVIGLTLFDSFRRAGQHALQVASERGGGKKREEGDSAAASDLPSLSSCVEEEHPLFFAALSRLLLQIDAANPLSLPKALTFFSRATEQERHTEKPGADSANSSCEDLVLLLSRVFDGLPSVGCPLYSAERFGQESEEERLARGRDGGPGVKGLSLFSALMASEVELRREGIRAALACFQRSKHPAQREKSEEKETRGTFLVELLLDRLQDEEPSLVVEAARGTVTVCRVLSPFVCLHRATSVLLMDLSSLLPSPLAASGRLSAPAFFSGGVSAKGAETSRASQCLVASVLLVPRLRVVVPALLHAAAQMLEQAAEDSSQAEEETDDGEKFAGEALTYHLLPLALALAWGTSRPDEKDEEVKSEDEEENSSALRKNKRKAFEELHAASLAVLNAVHKRREGEGKGENVEQLEVSTTQGRLASSTAFHALVRQVLLPLSSPLVTSTTSLRRMQPSLVVDAFLDRGTRLKTERREANASATSATCLYTTAALLEISGATVVDALSPSSDVPVWLFHLLHLCEFLQGLLATSAAEKTDSDFHSEKQGAKKTRPSAAPSAVSSLSDPHSPALSFPREARSAVKAVAAGVASFLLSRVPKGGAGATAEKTKKQRSHRASGSREEARGQGTHAEDGDGVSALPAALCSFFGSAEEENVGAVEEPIEGSEKSERRLRRRLLLLALSDLALFAPVVQSFLSAFQGHSLLFLALLSQFLSSVSFSQSRWSGVVPEGSDEAPAQPRKRREDEETSGAEAACSVFPASSCVSSRLWSPTEACELLASSPLRQQIEVNLVDLSRALLAQAGRGTEKRMQKSESKANAKKREECADMRDSEEREKGAERRSDATCVGLLVVPLWLSVHGRAEVREVREAVHLLLNELLSLLKKSQKAREKTSQKAKAETGASGVSPSLLKLWWRRLAHLGLLRRMQENEEGAGGRPENLKMHFFLQAVLQDAESSCREFLSLFLSGLSSASSALRPSLPSSQASHLRAEGPPSAVASVEHLVFRSAVTTASDGVSALLCFALACLLPAGKTQQAFGGLLRRGPPNRLLPALLPALEKEIEAFVAAFGSSECPLEREKSRSPSFQSAQSSPPASPSSFAFASPAPASPRDAVWAPSTVSPKPASLSPVIQLGWHLLGTLNASSLSSAAVLGPAAVKAQPLQGSLPTSRLSPDESKRLVSSFLLPFLRALSSPAPAASLRSFYLRPGEAPFSGESSGSSSRSLPLDFEVAQAAEAVIDGVFSSGLLPDLPDDLCVSLVLAVLRLASTTPQLAARLRLQDEALEIPVEGRVSAVTSRAPQKAGPRSEAMVSVATLVRLIQAIGAEDGEGGAPPVESASMRVGARDALLADFVESQLQARSSLEGSTAPHHGQRGAKAVERKQAASDTRKEVERLASCALEKVEAILNWFLASTKRSEDGTNSACNASAKEEGMEEAATRRTLESLLSMCAAACSAVGAGEAELARRKNSPKANRHSSASRLEVAGDRFDAGLPAHEEALRGLASVSSLLAQTYSAGRDESTTASDSKRDGRDATRGFTSSLVSPGLLAALLRSCASASERVTLAVKGRDKTSADLRVSSLHRALLDLLHKLGGVLARASLTSCRLVVAPLVLSAIRGYLPSLFSALDCLLCLLRGGEKPHGTETLEVQTPKPQASARLAEEDRRGREVKKEVVGLVQMLVEPLCAAAFQCLREQEKEGNGETGEDTVVPHSERVQRQAAVGELVVALGAALGREALVAGCLVILVRWEAASLKRQEDKKERDEAASASDEAEEADEAEDEETPQPAVATEVEGDSDDEVLLDRKARKERRKSERLGWGSRRALLERLKEILEAASGPEKPASFGSQLLAHAHLATGAVALQCEAREQLLPKNASPGKGPQTAASKEPEQDKGGNGLAVTADGGLLSRNLPSCVAERVTYVRQGLCDPKRRETFASVRFSFSDGSESAAEEHPAEIYCRAASTAVLLVYEQLKKEGLPNLERVGALSSTAFVLAGEGEEETQATQELVEALLSVKILAERRWLSGAASLSRSAKKRREVENASEETELEQRVFAEEAILKQRAELLLESIIRALSPLVGCMRLALGCLGVRHSFFVSLESGEELRRRFVEAKAGRGEDPQGDLTLASRRSSLTESDEEIETSGDSQPSIHLLLPSFPSPPLFSSASSTSLPETARLLLAGEAAHAAAEAVAEADSFARAPHMQTSSCDFVFFSLLFRGLASHLDSCLGAPTESVLALDGGKKKRRDDSRKGTEDRLWTTLFASSAWSEASLTAPYALLLALIAKRLLDPSARSCDSSLPVTAAGVSAWQLVTRLSRLAGGYVPEAFRDGALPSILLTLKKASARIPSLALEPSSGAAQANLRSLVALATAAARSLLALTLTSQGRAGENHGANMGQKTSRSLHAAALFLADFNTLFFRLAGLLRKLLPSLLDDAAPQDGREACARLMWIQDVLNRLLLVRDSRIAELATCLLAALLGLLQRVGTDFFLPHASTLIHATLLNPLLVSALSQDASEALPSPRLSLKALAAPEKTKSATDSGKLALDCMRRLAAPRAFCDASLQFYMVDASVDLPRVRRLASEVLEQSARQNSAFGFSSSLFGKREKVAPQRLGQKGRRAFDAETPDDAVWRERPAVDTMLSALAAELATSMRLQATITLLLPSLHGLLGKQKKAVTSGEKKRKEKASKAGSERSEGLDIEDEDCVFSKRGLQDFQASQAIKLLGAVIGAQPQSRADAKRPVLTKLMVHLVQLCLSRAEDSSACAARLFDKEKREEKSGKKEADGRMLHAERLAEQIFGGQVHDVHRQLLWGPESGDSRDLLSNDFADDEEEQNARDEVQKETKKRLRDEGMVLKFEDGEREEFSQKASLHTIEQSVRLLPPAAFAPAYLHRVEAALYCAFRSWSQKLSMQQLQAFLQSLLRSLRGPKRALLQPSAEEDEASDISKETEETHSAQGTDDEIEREASKKRKEKTGEKRTEKTLTTPASGFSTREICGTRLLVLFYTAAVRDFGSVGGVEALLEDLLADFQSALAACRDQALALVDASKDSGEKRGKTGSGSRGRVLESSATWFWFELGMPILLSLIASLRSWKKDLSGALPPSLFERLLTCVLDASDVLAVLPRLHLPGYSSRDEERFGSYSDMSGESEARRKRAQAQRLSKLWFCALRSLVTSLFEHAFGDKTRVEELNLSLLEKVRSCGKANMHFAAARIYLHLWKRLGVAMVDTLNDSLQTLVELLESPDDEVEMATREWVKAMENLTGESLDEKLKA